MSHLLPWLTLDSWVVSSELVFILLAQAWLSNEKALLTEPWSAYLVILLHSIIPCALVAVCSLLYFMWGNPAEWRITAYCSPWLIEYPWPGNLVMVGIFPQSKSTGGTNGGLSPFPPPFSSQETTRLIVFCFSV